MPLKPGDLLTSRHFKRGRHAGAHPTQPETIWVDIPSTGRWAFHVSDVRPLTEFSPAMEACLEKIRMRMTQGAMRLTSTIKEAKNAGFMTEEVLNAYHIREREESGA